MNAGPASGLPFPQVSALRGMGTALLDISPRLIDRIKEARTEALELIEKPLGSATGGMAWAELGFSLMLTGDSERAHEMFQKGLNESTGFMYLARPFLLVGSAFLALGGGDTESADQLVNEAKAFAEERAMKHFDPLISFADANISLARNDSARALESFNRAETLALEMGMRGFAWQSSAGAAGVLESLGQLEAAAAKKETAIAMVNEIAGLFKGQTLRSMYLEDTMAKIR